jgi:hypothetical protein
MVSSGRLRRVALLTIATWRNIPEDTIRHSHRRENLKSYINSMAFSPQAKYTDWATATCQRNVVPTFMDRGVSRGPRSGSPTVVNLSFPDRQILHRSNLFKEEHGDLLAVPTTLYIGGRTTFLSYWMFIMSVMLGR